MSKGTKERTNAKDLVIYWARKYQNVVGKKYFIRWMNDGVIFKRLLSKYKPQEVKQVIDTVFSNNISASYMRRNGYALSLLPSMFNQLLVSAERPWSTLDKFDLDLDTHFSVDYRTEFVWSCIRQGDIHSLICHITDEYYFHLLIAKMEYQVGWIPDKVMLFYEMWKEKEPLERTRICTHGGE